MKKLCEHDCPFCLKGLCHCGCGSPAPIAKENKGHGYKKGETQKFILGHCVRLRDQRLDLIGRRIGKLLVTSFAKTEGTGRKTVVYWNVLCDCGQERVMRTSTLSGKKPSQSCGCLNAGLEKMIALTEARKGVLVHDRTGQKFGRLTALRVVGRTKTNNAIWLCLCECGKEHPVVDSSFRSTKSCGCWNAEVMPVRLAKMQETLTTHGHTAGDKPSRTYRSWTSMLQRCLNPNHESYPDYGGAGVTACDQWLTFEGFLSSIGERPEGTTLSRFGDVGNYEPSNCAWHTKAQQTAEARKKRLLKKSVQSVGVAEKESAA